MDVIADGKRVYFDRPSLKFQHFPGVTVYTPTYILNQSEVIMMFDNGVGVEVLDNNGKLTFLWFIMLSHMLEFNEKVNTTNDFLYNYINTSNVGAKYQTEIFRKGVIRGVRKMCH